MSLQASRGPRPLQTLGWICSGSDFTQNLESLVQVSQILTAVGFGAPHVVMVTCPSWEPLQDGGLCSILASAGGPGTDPVFMSCSFHKISSPPLLSHHSGFLPSCHWFTSPSQGPHEPSIRPSPPKVHACPRSDPPPFLLVLACIRVLPWERYGHHVAAQVPALVPVCLVLLSTGDALCRPRGSH